MSHQESAWLPAILSGISRSSGSSRPRNQLVTAVLVAAVPLCVAVVVQTILDRQRRKKKNYPPGPPGVFFWGNALQVPNPKEGGFVEEKLLEWTKDYGMFYTIRLPFVGRELVVNDPELAKYCLVSKNYNKGFVYKLLDPVLGRKSMVSVNGKEWAKHRRSFNPGFAPSFLKNMVTTMAQKLERFINVIETADIQLHQSTPMLERAQLFTSDVIATIAFGEDWGGGGTTPHPARSWETELASLLNGIFLDPIVFFFGVRAYGGVRRYERLLDQEMMDILERRLKALATTTNEKHTTADATADDKDICSIAIHQIMEETGGALTKEHKIAITHQLKTFYFAGHDTTASLIAWTSWLLSQNKGVLEKIRDEQEKLGMWKDASYQPDYDDLQKCVYLEAVLKETLRLYPPASFLTRGHIGPDETYKGYDIGGCLIGINVYGIQRHPDLWKNPNEFRPERFLDGSESDIPSKFLAFSRGPRDCIGKYFAMLEAKLAISALAMRFDMECLDPTDRIVSHITTFPQKGAHVKYSRRQE